MGMPSPEGEGLGETDTLVCGEACRAGFSAGTFGGVFDSQRGLKFINPCQALTTGGFDPFRAFLARQRGDGLEFLSCFVGRHVCLSARELGMASDGAATPLSLTFSDVGSATYIRF